MYGLKVYFQTETDRREMFVSGIGWNRHTQQSEVTFTPGPHEVLWGSKDEAYAIADRLKRQLDPHAVKLSYQITLHRQGGLDMGVIHSTLPAH